MITIRDRGQTAGTRHLSWIGSLDGWSCGCRLIAQGTPEVSILWNGATVLDWTRAPSPTVDWEPTQGPGVLEVRIRPRPGERVTVEIRR